jgi:hypothetical protein
MHQVALDMVLGELDRLLSDRSLGRSSPWRIVYPDVDRVPNHGTLAVLR